MRARIGLDARMTRQMSIGMKAYTRELATRLPRVAPDLDFVTFSEGENFGWTEQVRLPLAMRAARVQLTHFLSLYVPIAAPRPFIVTIHDLIHLRFPGYFKAKVGPYYQTVVRLACRRAARVITDDQRTIADLQRFLGVDPERVRVIPLGVDDTFLGPVEPFDAPRPYIMYAGNHREHKDLPTLFAAWAGLPSDIALDLYVTGPDDFGDLSRYAREFGRIIALGEVSITQLASYYAGACALVHPALCEGFGLPMLEAMAVGCPVIACEDAVPSVLADVALTFPARSVRFARAALLEMLNRSDLRECLVAEGRKRARMLTWDACAAATAEVYREILQERSA
jgi:glycosyltransferase involved in cell wall biosynthesis